MGLQKGEPRLHDPGLRGDAEWALDHLPRLQKSKVL